MMKLQANPSAAHKRISVWLFLSFAIALVLCAMHLEREGGGWRKNFTKLQEWLFEEPQVKRAAKPAPSRVLPPAFDLAYVNETGKLVAAGRGETGWTISLQSEGAVLGEAKADENGEWVITPEQSLPPGDHSLSLLEIGPLGQQAVPGSRKVTLKVAAGK
jgi:hypothetical protein